MKDLLKRNLPGIPYCPESSFRAFGRMSLSLAMALFLAFPVFAQNIIKVSGRITNETGQAVQRASVIVKGTNNGVTADENGRYEISAPANGALIISSVEYASQEIDINGLSTIDITLSNLGKSENEIIVVGYGTLRSKDVTGAVVKVKGETLRELPAPNLVNQLKGVTAGVDVVSNGATPGATGQVRIRGNRSLAKTSTEANGLDEPLVVLDGIPFSGTINDINPEDVANLEVLKDASATAIYGARGSGGVILITTKKGRSGKPLFSYDGYVGTTSAMDKLKVFTGPEYAQFKDDAATYNRTNWPTSGGTSSYLLTEAEKEALANGVSTDWQDLIYKNGLITNHQLSILGGSDRTQYGVGLGYFKEEGIIPNQDFERFSIRTSIDHQIGKRVRIGVSSLNALSYTNTPGGNGVTSGLVRLTPLANPYNPDGTVNLHPAAGSIDDAFISPLTLETKSDAILAKTRRLRTFNSIYGEVTIIDGLKFHMNLGLDYSQSYGSSYNGPGTYTNYTESQASSNATTSNSDSWNVVMENLLTYEKTFNEKHKLGVTGLFALQKSHYENSAFRAVGIPADYILNSNFALASTISPDPNNPNDYWERGIVSYMARANYAYDNRFLLTATVRRDGASTLSPGNQYFTYPAFSVGWNIANEEFMNKSTFITSLKLRGGWGITSNQGVPPYATLGLLSTSTYNFGQGSQGQQQAYTVTTLANSSLKWQSTSQWNVGIDFGFFSNRLSGSLDVYGQKTKDILLDFNLPQSNGAGTTRKNLGKTKGNGLELNISSVNIESKKAGGFAWTTDFNFYFNHEEIVQLQTPDIKQDIPNGWFVGQPITVIYDLKKIGIWQTEDSAKGVLGQQTAPIQYPGQIRIEDVNGDGKIDADDRQILGNFQPKWEAGMTNHFYFMNFDLSFMVFARMGMDVLVPYLTADGGAQGFPFFMQSRANQVKVDYWTRNNPTNAFPAPDAGTDRFLFASTLGYRDGSFIKCRYINLGYQLPAKIFGNSGISSLRLYVNVSNPFILYSPLVSDGLAVDPEGNGYGGGVAVPTISGSVPVQGRQISVNANNPPVRQFIFGVNLKF